MRLIDLNFRFQVADKKIIPYMPNLNMRLLSRSINSSTIFARQRKNGGVDVIVASETVANETREVVHPLVAGETVAGETRRLLNHI